MVRWEKEEESLDVHEALAMLVGPRKEARALRMRAVSFRSQGSTVRGYLHTPAERKKGKLPPVVVMAHGFSATQHMGLMDTARAICSRTGVAVLTFDHCGFGISDGERHLFCHWGQVCGYLDAVTYLRQAESAVVDVDKICLWGESLSSRLALVAAAVEPDHVKALILVTLPAGRKVTAWTERNKSSRRRLSAGPLQSIGQHDGASQALAAYLKRRTTDKAAQDKAAQANDTPSTSLASATGANALLSAGSRAARTKRTPSCESLQSAISISEIDIEALDSAEVQQLAEQPQEPAVEKGDAFHEMLKQCESMRASTARLDDVSLGPTGGAIVPPIEMRYAFRVVPADQLYSSETAAPHDRDDSAEGSASHQVGYNGTIRTAPSGTYPYLLRSLEG